MADTGELNKKNFDASMRLAAFGAGRFDARRSYEWKLTLGLWFVLAAALGHFQATNIPRRFGIVTVVLYALWINKVRWSNFSDKALCEHYRDEAIKDLASAGVPQEEEVKIKCFVRIRECLK